MNRDTTQRSLQEATAFSFQFLYASSQSHSDPDQSGPEDKDQPKLEPFKVDPVSDGACRRLPRRHRRFLDLLVQIRVFVLGRDGCESAGGPRSGALRREGGHRRRVRENEGEVGCVVATVKDRHAAVVWGLAALGPVRCDVGHVDDGEARGVDGHWRVLRTEFDIAVARARKLAHHAGTVHESLTSQSRYVPTRAISTHPGLYFSD